MFEKRHSVKYLVVKYKGWYTFRRWDNGTV